MASVTEREAIMSYRALGAKLLNRSVISLQAANELDEVPSGFNDVVLVIMPAIVVPPAAADDCIQAICRYASRLGGRATLITLGEIQDLVHLHSEIPPEVCRFQQWIAIKRRTIADEPSNRSLPHQHFGALIHTRYRESLKHVKMRIAYSFCPACDKTTKDYGGKKHTYDAFGTLLSDVWRDIASDIEGDLSELFERFSDLFGTSHYVDFRVIDLRLCPRNLHPLSPVAKLSRVSRVKGTLTIPEDGMLINGDSVKTLKSFPDNSVDFAFADPPYNLGKNYHGYSDSLEIESYFHWCDEWIAELVRVLKPGRTLAVLNIPLWSIRHYRFLQEVATFQSWITWDALSYPVRLLMPAHYAILCFSKGRPRRLSGLVRRTPELRRFSDGTLVSPLACIAEGYCLRSSCVTSRNRPRLTDQGPITDLWWDIHRLKHNSRRVDHPCQLPPQLMYRLISLFTSSKETVLDCFNGAGTTTLCAQILDRKYIGIELLPEYHEIAESRHAELSSGLNPFRRVERVLTSKNSPVPRRPKMKYQVPKKTLQLDIRRIASQIGRLPSRHEVEELGRYPISYYIDYFSSWGEVCAAARATGMSETRRALSVGSPRPAQLSVFSQPKE